MMRLWKAIRSPLAIGAAPMLFGLLLSVDLPAQYAVPYRQFPPNVKSIWSRSKEFVADIDLDAKLTRISRVVWQGNTGRGTLLWSMPAAFSVGWLADDGDHLVVGYDGEKLIPPDYDRNQVMLSFFNRGNLIRQVRLRQLIGDFSKLEKSGVNYRWVRYLDLNSCGYLALETVEGKELLFDVTTGQAPGLKSAKAHETAGSRTYRDLLRCYELQYPRDDLLKEERNIYGTPMGWFSLRAARDKNWVAEGSVEDTADYPRGSVAASFSEFAFDRAGVKYSADGPDGSSYSGGAARQRSFVNRAGLDVIEFYLNIVHETYLEGTDKSKVEKQTVGPIYAVSVSAPGEPLKILLLRLLGDEGKQPPAGEEWLRQLAEGVRRGLTAP